MKKRYLYLFLFGVPGFFLSIFATAMLFGAIWGFLWLFVFGDSSPVLSSAFATNFTLPALIFLTLWIIFLVWGFRTGKSLESEESFNKKHLLISAVITCVCMVALFLISWNSGTIGPKSDTVRCGNFCNAKGYASSSMPPRDSGQDTCSCLDDMGNNAITVPLEQTPQ